MKPSPQKKNVKILAKGSVKRKVDAKKMKSKQVEIIRENSTKSQAV